MWRHTFSFYCSQSDVIRWLQSLISQSDCKCSASKANQAGIPPPTPPPFFYSPSLLLQLFVFFTFSPLCRVAFYLMYYSCGCCFYARGVQKQWNKGTLWEFPWVWPRCCDLYCFTHQKQRFNCFWSQSATGKIIFFPTAAKLYSTNTLPVRGPSLSLFSHLYPYSSRPTAVEQTQTSPQI